MDRLDWPDRPLKVETRVRTPLGLLIRIKTGWQWTARHR